MKIETLGNVFEQVANSPSKQFLTVQQSDSGAWDLFQISSNKPSAWDFQNLTVIVSYTQTECTRHFEACFDRNAQVDVKKTTIAFGKVIMGLHVLQNRLQKSIYSSNYLIRPLRIIRANEANHWFKCTTELLTKFQSRLHLCK